METRFLLLGAVALQMVGFGIILPAMPFLLRELGGDAAAQGLLVSLFSLMQFVTAPLWGYVSDKIGRAPVVAAGLALGAAGQAVAYAAHSLAQLALGRALAGVGGGTLAALQAWIADLTPSDRRASAMALFGIAFGVGFVAGPAIGGALGTLHPRLPFLASALLYALAGAAVARLPNTRPTRRQGFEIAVGLLAAPVLMLNLGMSMFEALLSYFSAFARGLTPFQIGLLFLVSGVAAGAAQPVVRRLERSSSPGKNAPLGMATMATGLLLLSLASNSLAALYIGAALVSLGGVVASSFIFAAASRRGAGVELGALQSAGTLGRIAGPAIGGYLYTTISATAPFIASAAVVATTAAFTSLLLSRAVVR